MSSKRRPLPPPSRDPRARQAPPRVNAAHQAASWPDVLVAFAATALTMGLLIFVATFSGENVVGGEAGRFWALTFASALGLSGLFLVLLGLVLLRDGARRWGRYLVPVAVGVGAGAIVGALVLDGASRGAVLAPLLLLVLALPPVREGLAWLLRRPGGGSAR